MLLGLLASNMTATAQGIVDNMLDVVSRFGFMPNGAKWRACTTQTEANKEARIDFPSCLGLRIYYLNRSQPPLLTPMVELLYNATQVCGLRF